MQLETILQDFQGVLPEPLQAYLDAHNKGLAGSVPSITAWLRDFSREQVESQHVELAILANRLALAVANQDVTKALALRYPNQEIAVKGRLSSDAFEQQRYLFLRDAGESIVYASPAVITDATQADYFQIALAQSHPQQTVAQKEAWLTLQAIYSYKNLKNKDVKQLFIDTRGQRLSVLSLQHCQDEGMAKFWQSFVGVGNDDHRWTAVALSVQPIDDVGAAWKLLKADLKKPQLTKASDILASFNHAKLKIIVQDFIRDFERQVCPHLAALGETAAIENFLQKRLYTRTGVGYTAMPWHPMNLFCAQLAITIISDTHHAQKRKAFWQRLYPDVEKSMLAQHDEHWPNYGEAVLSHENASMIFNWRQMTQLVQSSDVVKILCGHEVEKPEDHILISCFEAMAGDAVVAMSDLYRLSKFSTHPQAVLVWEKVGALSKPVKFNNFYEFFIGLMEVASTNNVHKPDSGAREHDAGSAAHVDIYVYLNTMASPEYNFIISLLEAYKNRLKQSPWNSRAVIESIDYLLKIRHSLIVMGGSGSLVTCLADHGEELKKALAHNGIVEILSAQQVARFTAWGNASVSEGVEKMPLPILPNVFIDIRFDDVNIASLSSCIDQAEDDFIIRVAENYRHYLESKKNKSGSFKALYNFVYQITASDKKNIFISSFFGIQDFALGDYLKTLDDCNYALMLAPAFPSALSLNELGVKIAASIRSMCAGNLRGKTLLDEISPAYVTRLLENCYAHLPNAREVIKLIGELLKIDYTNTTFLWHNLSVADALRLAEMLQKTGVILKSSISWLEFKNYLEMVRPSVDEIFSNILTLNLIYRDHDDKDLSKLISKRIEEKEPDLEDLITKIKDFFENLSSIQGNRISTTLPAKTIQNALESALSRVAGRSVGSLQRLLDVHALLIERMSCACEITLTYQFQFATIRNDLMHHRFIGKLSVDQAVAILRTLKLLSPRTDTNDDVFKVVIQNLDLAQLNDSLRYFFTALAGLSKSSLIKVADMFMRHHTPIVMREHGVACLIRNFPEILRDDIIIYFSKIITTNLQVPIVFETYMAVLAKNNWDFPLLNKLLVTHCQSRKSDFQAMLCNYIRDTKTLNFCLFVDLQRQISLEVEDVKRYLNLLESLSIDQGSLSFDHVLYIMKFLDEGGLKRIFILAPDIFYCISKTGNSQENKLTVDALLQAMPDEKRNFIINEILPDKKIRIFPHRKAKKFSRGDFLLLASLPDSIIKSKLLDSRVSFLSMQADEEDFLFREKTKPDNGNMPDYIPIGFLAGLVYLYYSTNGMESDKLYTNLSALLIESFSKSDLPDNLKIFYYIMLVKSLPVNMTSVFMFAVKDSSPSFMYYHSTRLYVLSKLRKECGMFRAGKFYDLYKDDMICQLPAQSCDSAGVVYIHPLYFMQSISGNNPSDIQAHIKSTFNAVVDSELDQYFHDLSVCVQMGHEGAASGSIWLPIIDALAEPRKTLVITAYCHTFKKSFLRDCLSVESVTEMLASFLYVDTCHNDIKLIILRFTKMLNVFLDQTWFNKPNFFYTTQYSAIQNFLQPCDDKGNNSQQQVSIEFFRGLLGLIQQHVVLRDLWLIAINDDANTRVAKLYHFCFASNPLAVSQSFGATIFTAQTLSTYSASLNTGTLCEPGSRLAQIKRACG